MNRHSPCLAMQLVTDTMVLGDFDNSSLDHFGLKSSFAEKAARTVTVM